MTHPYQNLPKSAYWKTAVSDLNPLESSDLWIPKHALGPDDQAVTFGSCFAQHLSRALIKNGFGWLDAEPGPELASNELKIRHNYGVFSARTGNIYTTKGLCCTTGRPFVQQSPFAVVRAFGYQHCRHNCMLRLSYFTIDASQKYCAYYAKN